MLGLVGLLSLFETAFLIGGGIAALIYFDRMSKDLAHIRSLLTAFMEQRVAGTLAEHKLAAAVEQAKKAPTPAGVAR
jgi:hypothetical protein